MFGSTLKIAAFAACLWFQTEAAAQTSYGPPLQTGEFDAMATLEIDANGKVTRVVPDPSLQAAVRAPLEAHVLRWEFEAPKFQSRPVQMNARLWVRLQLAPTSSGGYGIRVVSGDVLMGPPLGPFPPLNFARRPKENETLVYLVSVDTEGRNAGLELTLPEKPSRTARTMDAATRFALTQAVPFQRRADGHAVTCRLVFTMTRQVAGESAPTRGYTAETEALSNALIDKCPTTRLLTKVAGTTL